MSLAEAEDGIGALERSGIRVGGVDRQPRRSRGSAVSGLRSPPRRRTARDRSHRAAPRPRADASGRSRATDRTARRGGARRIGQRLTRDPASAGSVRLKADATDVPRSGSKPDPTGSALSLREDARTTSPESLEAFRDAELLFFGGKGGVGKTTVAATVALRLARAEPRRAVLLLSTDPAHSLGDVFGQPVGDRPVRLRGGPGNLHVRELDAAAALASRRAGLEAALNEIGAAFGAGAGFSGRWTRGRRVDGAGARPASTSCSASFRWSKRAIDFRSSSWIPRRPGHALRLLEMPDAAREWVQVLLRVLLKYRSLVRPGQLASELVDLSKSIRRLQELLRNPRDTRFVVVTRAAAVPRLETERLLGRLRRLRLAAPAVIVNAMTLAPGRCPLCRATAAAERRELALLSASSEAVRYHPDPARGAAASRSGRARSLGGLVDRERSPHPSTGSGCLSTSNGRGSRDSLLVNGLRPSALASRIRCDLMATPGTYVYCLIAADRRPVVRRRFARLPGMGPVRLLDVGRASVAGCGRCASRAGTARRRSTESCRTSTGCRAPRSRTKPSSSRSSTSGRCCR